MDDTKVFIYMIFGEGRGLAIAGAATVRLCQLLSVEAGTSFQDVLVDHSVAS